MGAKPIAALRPFFCVQAHRRPKGFAPRGPDNGGRQKPRRVAARLGGRGRTALPRDNGRLLRGLRAARMVRARKACAEQTNDERRTGGLVVALRRHCLGFAPPVLSTLPASNASHRLRCCPATRRGRFFYGAVSAGIGRGFAVPRGGGRLLWRSFRRNRLRLGNALRAGGGRGFAVPRGGGGFYGAVSAGTASGSAMRSAPEVVAALPFHATYTGDVHCAWPNTSVTQNTMA